MESRESFPMPPILTGYTLNGRVIVSGRSSFIEEKFYIKGIHPDLYLIGPIRFLTGLGGLPETEITLFRIVPVAMFMVAEEPVQSAKSDVS
ncbi:MAG: hypothetical protein KGJ13_02625 [Patescibacteria group bacterium]|nr:hypothetical protein [Patescibacteria group bacterium]